MTLVAYISGFFISGIILSPNEIENERKMKSAIMCALDLGMQPVV